MENETSKTDETKALNIADVMHGAFMKGYEQRVIDPLQGALDGEPVGSHFNEAKLKALADKYVSQHCA